ncbi:MAG: hypothetical protein HYT11_00400 [Candidatus Levybacteria bacterium]|nr:hypothetical protein [Candidatus Levybacteria bacterium]
MTINKAHTWLHVIITFFSCFAKAFVWSIAGLAFATTGGNMLASQRAPFDIIFGIPMVVIGIGFIVHGFVDMSMCAFSPKYNRAVCFFCSNNMHTKA